MRLKPLIGVSANWADETSRVAQAYLDAIAAAGGVPVILSLTDDSDQIEQYVMRIDGLVLTGGGDIDPQLWGEKIIPQSGEPSRYRDLYDINLYRLARRRQIPVLGICRGMQVMNVAEGGSIYQDIYTQISRKLLHHSQKAPKNEAAHSVNIAAESRLAKLFGATEIEVNTLHHQAVRDISHVFNPVAFSSDNICEAIECADYPVLGVQWHPEHLVQGYPEQRALFEWIVKEAELQAHAVEIHCSAVVVDSHTDTPMVWTSGMNLGEYQEETKVDFVKMREGHIDASFMVAYLPQKGLNKTESDEAKAIALDTFRKIRSQIDNNSEEVAQAFSPVDVESMKAEGRRSIVLGLENGYALAGNLSSVEQVYDLGVRYITLCHNGDNDLCDSAKGSNTHGGLSAFGREVIAEMNRLGMLVDISHAGDESMRQAIDYSRAPVVATHSCARALCEHGRNMTDDLLRRLAERGGVCQVCLYDYFLDEKGNASVETAVRHIEHIIDVAGIDHVGIGSDFDGGGGIIGCQSSNELINITKALILRGHSDEEIRKIIGGNFMRVWREVAIK